MTHTLYEMARIGNTSDNIEIHIYGKEGNIPHFHFYDRKDERMGCIRIDKAEYFSHGKGKYADKLSAKEIYNLIEFLNSQHKRLPITNWQYLIILWNDNNPDFEIDMLKTPDYSKL